MLYLNESLPVLWVILIILLLWFFYLLSLKHQQDLWSFVNGDRVKAVLVDDVHKVLLVMHTECIVKCVCMKEGKHSLYTYTIHTVKDIYRT